MSYPINQRAHQFNSIQSVPVSFGLWDTALKFLSPGPRSDVTDHLACVAGMKRSREMWLKERKSSLDWGASFMYFSSLILPFSFPFNAYHVHVHVVLSNPGYPISSWTGCSLQASSPFFVELSMLRENPQTNDEAHGWPLATATPKLKSLLTGYHGFHQGSFTKRQTGWADRSFQNERVGFSWNLH